MVPTNKVFQQLIFIGLQLNKLKQNGKVFGCFIKFRHTSIQIELNLKQMLQK